MSLQQQNIDSIPGYDFMCIFEDQVLFPTIESSNSICTDYEIKISQKSHIELSDSKQKLETLIFQKSENNQIRKNLRNLILRMDELEKAVERLEKIIFFGETTNPSQNLSISKNLQCKKLQKSHLDLYCPKLANRQLNPDTSKLRDLVRELLIHFSLENSPKNTMSEVRRWFRKYRESLGLRVISTFQNLRSTEYIKHMEDQDIIRALDNKSFDMKAFLNAAKLPIKDSDVAESFCRDKIITYLQRKQT